MPTSPFLDLLASARRSAIHLEMRDVYAEHGSHGLIGEAAARGVEVRRARIVSEPLSPYRRYEHSITESVNVAAGENVRWLSRARTLDLCLPGLDFWLVDNHTLLAHHFSGEGVLVRYEIVTSPAVIKHCGNAFAAIWRRAVPHAEYHPP